MTEQFYFAVGFSSLTQHLRLDARISAIANLGATKDGYDCIDLSNNEIQKLENIPLLPRLRTLVC